MLTQEKLVQTPDYWMETIQNSLYNEVSEYMERNKINQSQLANELEVSKGYVSQVLKGNFNYTLKKLIELSLHIGRVPDLEFKTVSDYLANENNHLNKIAVIISDEPFTVTRGSGQNISAQENKPLLSRFSLSVATAPVMDNNTKIA